MIFLVVEKGVHIICLCLSCMETIVSGKVFIFILSETQKITSARVVSSNILLKLFKTKKTLVRNKKCSAVTKTKKRFMREHGFLL
jgi:hypothetical protein